MAYYLSDLGWTVVNDQQVFAIADSYRPFTGQQVFVFLPRLKGTTSPDPENQVLLFSIFDNFNSILERAKSALRDYAAATMDESSLEHVSAASIFVTSDSLKWEFGLERDDWEDFGWHIEFSGTDLVQVWTGS